MTSTEATSTGTGRSTHQAMKLSNATQPTNSTHGMTLLIQSGVPRFQAHRRSPAIVNLIWYLDAT